MGWKMCVQKCSLNLTFYSTRQAPDYFCYIMVDVQTLLEAFLNMSLRCSVAVMKLFLVKSETCGLQPLIFKCQIIGCRIKEIVLCDIQGVIKMFRD